MSRAGGVKEVSTKAGQGWSARVRVVPDTSRVDESPT